MSFALDGLHKVSLAREAKEARPEDLTGPGREGLRGSLIWPTRVTRQ